MKALVLAAGLGTRLRPWTDVLPKPLFPVLGIPSIMWAMAALRNAGVTGAVVNLHHLPQPIMNLMRRCPPPGIDIAFSFEPEILGTGGALVAARDRLEGEGPFLVHNADIFCDWDFSCLAALPAPVLAVTDGPGLPDSDRRVELGRNGLVAGLRGQPSCGSGRRVVYGGIARLDGSVIDRVARSMPGWPGRLSEACLVADALIPMIRDGQAVHAVEYDSRWYCDTGTPESYLELNFRALGDVEGLLSRRGFPVPREIEPGVFVASGAMIGRGVLFCPPVVVCDGAVVGADAVAGPRAVISGHVAAGCRVRDAVVMAGAVARGMVSGIVAPGGGMDA